MKLVKFEDPIWSTFQGEGTLVGTPSTFVRMWGCDFSCSWCDTKDSWRPGSEFIEMSVDEVVDRVRELHPRHVVVTGGNPLLQMDELLDLCMCLHTPMPAISGRVDVWKQRHHITVESQGNIYDENVLRWVDLLSLSPKLYTPDAAWESVTQYVRQTTWRGVTAPSVQVKIVFQDPYELARAIDKILGLHDQVPGDCRVEYILQPEYLAFKHTPRTATAETLRQLSLHAKADFLLRRVRCIPQVHKFMGAR